MAITLPAADQALIDEYKKSWAAAQAIGDTHGMNEAHAGAERVRAKYHFSGGADGSGVYSIPAEGTGNYESIGSSSEQYIKDIYAAKAEANRQALEAAYNMNVNSLNAAAAKLPQQYQTARNSAASQAEIQKANFNEMAAANGLNSGTGSQAALAMGNQLQSNLSGISQAEANAMSGFELQRTQLAAKYQYDITQAIAEGKLKEAQMLYDNYVRQDAKLTQ